MDNHSCIEKKRKDKVKSLELARYANGDLGPERKEFILGHLERCASCKRRLALMMESRGTAAQA